MTDHVQIIRLALTTWASTETRRDALAALDVLEAALYTLRDELERSHQYSAWHADAAEAGDRLREFVEAERYNLALALATRQEPLPLVKCEECGAKREGFLSDFGEQCVT